MFLLLIWTKKKHISTWYKIYIVNTALKSLSFIRDHYKFIALFSMKNVFAITFILFVCLFVLFSKAYWVFKCKTKLIADWIVKFIRNIFCKRKFDRKVMQSSWNVMYFVIKYIENTLKRAQKRLHIFSKFNTFPHIFRIYWNKFSIPFFFLLLIICSNFIFLDVSMFWFCINTFMWVVALV